MRVFVTGATGFIGSRVVVELIEAGHQVVGLSRSESKAAALAATGAQVQLGTIEDVDLLRACADAADGVVHLAFNHDDFGSGFLEHCANDRRAIAAMGAAFAGSDRKLVVTSGTAMALPVDGKPATEDGPLLSAEVNPRVASEEAALALAGDGVNVSVVRLPQVHDPVRQGLTPMVTAIAREKGVFAYIGEGHNRWPAAHISDVPRLYRLALEKGAPGARYHAVAEEGIAMRDIAETIGKRLGLPTKSIPPAEAEAQYGWMARFVVHDMPASSAWTRATLGWTPTGPGLLADLARLEVE